VDKRLESLTSFGLPGVRAWLGGAAAGQSVTVGCMNDGRLSKRTIGSVCLSACRPVYVLPFSSLRALRTWHLVMNVEGDRQYLRFQALDRFDIDA
jgi:hypothetical protein